MFRPLHYRTVKRCRDYSLWGVFCGFLSDMSSSCSCREFVSSTIARLCGTLFTPPLPIMKGALYSSLGRDHCWPTLLVCMDCGAVSCFIVTRAMGSFCVFLPHFVLGYVFFPSAQIEDRFLPHLQNVYYSVVSLGDWDVDLSLVGLLPVQTSFWGSDVCLCFPLSMLGVWILSQLRTV